MTALLLDTLRLSRALQGKGNFTSEQAEALAEALGEASQGDLATKTDLAGVRTEIAGLKTELKTELAGVGTGIAELRTELKSEIAGARGELKSEIAGVGTDIAELRTELKTEIDSVRAELKADNAELRTELKAEIAETRKDLLKWIIGAIGFQTVVMLGALNDTARRPSLLNRRAIGLASGGRMRVLLESSSTDIQWMTSLSRARLSIVRDRSSQARNLFDIIG